MNHEDTICPFCHGTGKIQTQNYLTYYFDNMVYFQPVDMNIRYTFGNSAEN